MTRKLFMLTTLLCAIGFTAEAIAVPRILEQAEEGVEAGKIVITLSKDKLTGTVDVDDCRLCPLQLKIDGSTSFFFRNKPINRDEAVTHSGKSGAIFFHKEHTNRIRW